jgi:hypothetical protein
MTKDLCISCGVETPYDFETHIDMRIGYVEGVGQLCSKCYSQDNNHKYITVPKSLIENTPNDQKLGGEVRSIYWQSKK